MSDNSLESALELLLSIRTFVTKPVDVTIGSISIQKEFFQLIFYLEVCIKLRDVLETYDLIENSFFIRDK